MGTLYGYFLTNGNGDEVMSGMKRMRDYGVSEDKIYINTSGNTGMLSSVLRNMGQGDTIVMGDLNCLGNGLKEIAKNWKRITEEMGCEAVILEMADLDIKTQQISDEDPADIARDMMNLSLDYILKSLCEIDKKERSERSREGLDRVRNMGVKLGRRPAKRPDNYPDVYASWSRDEISTKKASALLGVDYKTFQKWSAMDREKEELVRK